MKLKIQKKMKNKSLFEIKIDGKRSYDSVVK